MPRMPGAVWQGEQSPRTPMSRYDVVCVHTIVGFAPAHAAHFSTKGDGAIIQSRDTLYRSAANLDGNHRVIAIENEDHGPVFGGTPKLPGWVPLTDAQVSACAEILAWAHETHGVPLQLCPDSRPGSRGLAYHRQGVDGNFGGYRYGGRKSGGEKWSSAFGKLCPTDVRITQLPLILERATALVAGRPITEEDDMADYAKQIDNIEGIVERLLHRDQQAGKTATRRYRDLRDRAKADAKRDGKVTLTLDEVRDLLGDGGTDENGEGKERRVP